MGGRGRLADGLSGVRLLLMLGSKDKVAEVGWLVGWLMESLYSYAGVDSHENGASTP